MVSLAHRYKDLVPLGSADVPMDSAEVDVLEDIQLASFDSGYQAGWEDARKAHEIAVDETSAGISRNLQDMSFTHREAYLKLATAMRPLFTLMLERLLPQVAQKALGLHILDQLASLMDTHAQDALEIAVSAENIDEITALLADMAHVPFALAADPSLGTGQAYLRTAQAEQEINLDAVLSGISEAFDAFFDHTERENADD